MLPDLFPARLRGPGRARGTPRRHGDWLDDSSGESTDAPSFPPEAADRSCDCALDWITLRHSHGCRLSWNS
ncbi:hypothetical protein YW3DRAFT_01865 [Streptomyces sp. MnatMP-M77]|nr:hypothetical protein SACT1_1503 [Streptomyces sp. ACT-1]SBV04561.1 hypothetical protein YW3DRAFT_01865 [Streptomyces sp. MnatMP-M77]